tara:strand:+ start:7481 stop:8953 length:1473 start_codon:yes stop_codon:yes gene_type:complete
MSESTNVYADILKYDDNGDGTLTVYGKATDDSVDIDQQICDPAWLDKAMPDWFRTGGNIREQHSNIAAGVAQEYESKADGHYISALVVDPVSVKKVQNRVLRGFSIGIKSPRVVRDTKAANGRIIDGQIVEISLVDRPANPNCQLVLAKSVDGEKSLVQVEEMKMTTAQNIVTELKKFAPADIVKFDQAAYDNARRALAQLVMAEAKEMEEGEDEEMSFAILFGAISSLMRWKEHEEAEGEVAEESGEIEMAANPIADETVSEAIGEEKAEDAICPDCGKTEKMCKCSKAVKELVDDNDNETDKSTDMEKSVHKCLECGCNMPADSHGRDDVSTAEMVQEKTTATEIIPNPEVDEPIIPGIETEELEDSEDKSSDKSLLADINIQDIVEKAVKSAMKSVEAEVAELKTAKDAVENKAASLETELATAKSLAIGGGPKRTTIATGASTTNEWKAKADLYFAKSSATTDQILAKGYRDMAKDFLAKAVSPAE